MEIYLPERYAEDIIRIAAGFNIGAQVIGRVEAHSGAKVTVKSPLGLFEYTES
jgi:phosphoribosylformylglycinamidine cyclo-ligase